MRFESAFRYKVFEILNRWFPDPHFTPLEVKQIQRHTREHIYSQRQRHIAKRLRFYRNVWSDEFHPYDFLLSPSGRFSKNHPNPDSETKEYRRYHRALNSYDRKRAKHVLDWELDEAMSDRLYKQSELPQEN